MRAASPVDPARDARLLGLALESPKASEASFHLHPIGRLRRTQDANRRTQGEPQPLCRPLCDRRRSQLRTTCSVQLHRTVDMGGLPRRPLTHRWILPSPVLRLYRSNASRPGLKRIAGESDLTSCLHGTAVVHYWAVCAHSRDRRIASFDSAFALPFYRGVSGSAHVRRKGLSVATQLK